MQLPDRKVVINEAVRRRVPLLFGIFAIWDGGKTLSAIKVGRGMSEILAGDPDALHVIDTEGNRALAYADEYRFKHIPFSPPHGSLDYLVHINKCVDNGAKVIVVDTVTHEHYGIGGYLDTCDTEMYRLAELWKLKKPEGAKWSAKNIAASRRKELIRHIEQLGKDGVAMIFCFRASEKIKIPQKGETTETGEKKPVEMGYMPDTKESLMFLMTASALLMPRAKGVPTWKSEKPGEQLMIKLPGYFGGVFKDGEALNEEHGRRMAMWAKGVQTNAEKTLPQRVGEVKDALRKKKALDDVAEVWRLAAEVRGALSAAGQADTDDAAEARQMLSGLQQFYAVRRRELGARD